MPAYRISRLAVQSLWGGRDYDISFFEDMNILIGPNASGKTTIINLLHYTLTANIPNLTHYGFDRLTIDLHDFASDATATIEVTQHSETTEFRFEDFEIDVPRGLTDWSESRLSPRSARRRISELTEDLEHTLARKVPAVWLPVSRRLPIPEEDYPDPRRLTRSHLESVDVCLAELLSKLQKYRVSLDSQLSELRKEFQRHALETILYDKNHDRVYGKPLDFTAPTALQRQQLENAFTDLGFIDDALRARISDHFAAATQAIKNLGTPAKEPDEYFDTLLVIPLINRTNSMVKFAQQLESQRTDLFASLSRYEDIVSDFLANKRVRVDAKGNLMISSSLNHLEDLTWRHLSSGEKQILILLTQALLYERDPVIYVADEPELSLHVTWQEKLLKSLSTLAGQCQFIVATHSPDVAGGFPDRIIDLARI